MERNLLCRTYFQTNDTGFAPNPCHGFLTLANCMKRIRKTTPTLLKDNDEVWIAGFCGIELSKKVCKGQMDNVQKLIYLAKVTKHVDYETYWNAPEYQCKKPLSEEAFEKKYHPKSIKEIKEQIEKNVIDITDLSYQEICGDNIWSGIDENTDMTTIKKSGCGGEKKIPTKPVKNLDIWNHNGLWGNDKRGENVLICNEFYYFGADNALDIPQIKIALHPKYRHKDIYNQTLIKELIEFVRNNKQHLKELKNNGVYEG